MKKLLLSLSIIIVMVCITGCGNENEKRLKREIEAVDKQCPIDMGMLGDIVSIKYDATAKEVQVNYSIKEDQSIDALKNNEQMALQSIKLSFSRGDSRNILPYIINAGAGLSFDFKSALTGESLFKANFSLDDLKGIWDNPMNDSDINEMLLINQLAMENSNCPYPVEEGMDMVKVFDEGDNVVYVCQIDEKMYDLSLLESAQDLIKQNMIEVLKDPIAKKQLEIIASLDKGLVYRYLGDTSGESFDVVFSTDELNRIF